MRIFIRAKTNAREEGVEPIDATHFVVRVKASPKEGKANAAIERALAEHFRVPQMSVWIVSGKTAKEKVVEIMGM